MQHVTETPEQHPLQPVLEQILQNAVRALGGSAAVAATWDDATRRYIVSGSYGIDHRELDRLRPLLDEAIPDLAESREHFNLLSELAPRNSLPVSQQGQPQDPIIALPLRIAGNTVGLVYVLRSQEAATFSNLDPPTLMAFTEQMAIAVQNARLVHMLAQEKQRIESILEGSADGIYTVDSQRRVVALNSAMERLLGRPKEEVIGQLCSNIIALRDKEGRAYCPGRCPMLMPLEEGKAVVPVEGKVRSLEGRETEVAAVYSIVRSPEGQPLNAVVNVRDVSAIREMENLRSVFLSMLGHQLQTPLQIIKGFANTLSRDGTRWDENVLRQSAQAIEEEADRLSLLMNRLLLASRLESRELVLAREPVQLEALAQKVVRRIQTMSADHSFAMHFAPDFPEVSGDPDLLEEVLVNLVDNAVKYSPQGGTVRIQGEVEEDRVSVSVIDEGVGIPWWETRRIFERFHRGGNQLSESTRGMGLGLYICNAIVVAHGGQIDVATKPGVGSQFSVVLPIEIA